MKSYLPKFYFLLIGFFLLLSYLVSFYWLLLFLLGVATFLFLLFRRKKSFYKEEASIKRGVIYAPVSGKVLNIVKRDDHFFFGSHLYEIQMVTSWWSESGVFLPTTSEVREIHVEPGKSWFRYNKSAVLEQNGQLMAGLAIKFLSVDQHDFGLQFLKCPLGAWPEISVIPGDRGKRQVNIGYFPLGGTTLLYIPEEYEILIGEGDDVISGQTMVAGLKVSSDDQIEEIKVEG
jgi:hypothetical protein